MDPHNMVAFHHHRATDSGVDIVESNLNSTNGNLSAVAAAAVAAAAVQTSATVSNNFALSQRLNLMAATIFANSNNHSNTAAVAAAAANSAFPFLSSTSSVTATPIERISPAIINSGSNTINISNSAAQFHSAAQSFVQQQPQSATAAMAAAAAAALANLPSIAAAAAAASASSASTNNAAEYVAVAAAAAQQAANVNNIDTLETLNELRHNVVYPTNFSSYLEQNIQNAAINASSTSTIAAQQYALISSPFCTTASLNHSTCPMHRFVTSHFADNDDNPTFSMINTQRPFSFLSNSNNGVRQNSIQDNLQQTAQQRFLLVDNPNTYNRHRSSTLSSSIVASNASRVMKRNALQISTNNSQSIEHQNNRVLTESLRNQTGNNQILSTVIIPTSSSSNNSDDLRSRILEDSSRLLTASSSRAPKLRRIGSIEEDIVSGNSNLQAVATTAIVQLQRQQQTQATNTIMPFGGSVPNATLIQHNQQQEHHRLQQLQHVRSIINNSDNVINPIATILQQNPPSSTTTSSVTLEQFMAAINAATLPTTRGLTTYTTIPQSPTIGRPSSVSQTPEPSAHCAVCYQSTAATLIATPAAVTACNCVHHHHCHPQTICTICQQQQTQLNNQQQQNQQHSVVAAAVAAFQQQQSIGHFVTAGASSTVVRHSPTMASAGAPTLALPSTLINIAASLAQQTQNVAMVAQQNSVPASHFPHINRTDLNPMHTALLASRYAQQERDQQSSALFYRQQQQNQQQSQALNQQQPVITSPLIMVEQHPAAAMMGLSMLVFRPSDTATLVLNGAGATQASVVHQHAAVAAAAAAAAAVADAAVPEPQPVGVTPEQIKKYSSFLNYIKDPKIPEQERERCTVCLIDFETDDKLRSLHCSHLFHIECIDRWLIYNKKCPVCRVDMDKAPAAPATQPFISAATTAFS